MNLTSRTKKILYILLEKSEYITIQQIADKIGVSSRTVIREMNLVKEWLQEQQVYLDRKKGTGIKILAKDIERQALQNRLMGEKKDSYFRPELRYERLKFELLQTYEPRKMYSFTELFDVTEGTISNDFDHIESWFKRFDIGLIRKQGVGVYIKGNEIAIRRAMVALIYENIQEPDLIQFIKKKELNKPMNLSTYQREVKAYLLELMEVNYIDRIKGLLDYLEGCMGYQLADNAFIALIIRFSVTLKRIEQKIFVSIAQPLHQQLESKEHTVIKDWLSKDLVLKLLNIPKDEIDYLTMHVKGAKRREVSHNNQISIIEDYRLIKMAKKIIYIAEAETGAYLEDNEKLLVGLVRHLGPAINRVKLNLDIMNPLLEDIKNSYPKLFQATKQCVKVIEEQEGIIVPEDEIAYLATHIGAALKKEKRAINKKFRVAIACTNGIGASRLLASEIEREFNNLDIVDILSTLDLDDTILNHLNIDMVITTVPINSISIPTVLVGTILMNEDKQRLRKFLEDFVPSTNAVVKRQQISLKEKLYNLNKYSQSIMQILNHFFLLEDLVCKDMSELIDRASGAITRDESEKQQLIQAFNNREEKGTTLLSQKGMILLHCRSHAISELYFMVIRLKNKIKITDKRGNDYEINTIAVMVAPIEVKGYELEVLSEISRQIITNNFGQALRKSDETDLFQSLNDILEEFYQKKVYNLSSS